MDDIQIGMIDIGISTCSLSVLLSAMEMSLRTRTDLEITHAAQASCGYCSKLAFISLIAPDCAATIRGWHLIEEVQ